MKRSIEGVVRTGTTGPQPTTARPQTARPSHASSQPTTAPNRVTRTYAKPTVKTKRQLPAWLQLGGISIGTILLGSLVQSAALGQLAIVIYGICALIWRIASRTTFTLAVLSFAATIWMLVMQINVTLAQNFATYTFLLLVVGVITLSRELKREGGRIYSNRRTNTDH